MTNSEAIKLLKSKMDGSVDTSYEWCECVRMAIKALEQKPILDKIKAEIDGYCSDNRDRNDGLYIAMRIIDKYKAESEGEE